MKEGYCIIFSGERWKCSEQAMSWVKFEAFFTLIRVSPFAYSLFILDNKVVIEVSIFFNKIWFEHTGRLFSDQANFDDDLTIHLFFAIFPPFLRKKDKRLLEIPFLFNYDTLQDREKEEKEIRERYIKMELMIFFDIILFHVFWGVNVSLRHSLVSKIIVSQTSWKFAGAWLWG